MSYGRKMKARRKELDMTARDLAKLLGVSTSTVFSYENMAREPGIEKMSAIAKALNMDVSDLFFEKETKGENDK